MYCYCGVCQEYSRQPMGAQLYPDWVLTVGRSAIGAYVAWAALSKLRAGPESVSLGLADYALIPRGWHAVVGAVLIGVELALAAATLIGPADIGAAGLVAMFALFAVILGVEIVSGRRHGCACFGADDGRIIGWDLVGQNVGLAVVAFFIASSGSVSDPVWSYVFAHGSDGALAAFMSVGLLLLLLLWAEAPATTEAYRQWLGGYERLARELARGRRTPGVAREDI